jgi:hypothetical protein
MRTNLTKMTNDQIRKTAAKFRMAPCLVCEKKSSGFRKIPIGDQVALIPLCEKCLDAETSTLLSAMQIANYTQPASKVTNRLS